MIGTDGKKEAGKYTLSTLLGDDGNLRDKNLVTNLNVCIKTGQFLEGTKNLWV